MTTIWRFELVVTDRPAVEMPAGARVLPAPPSGRNDDRIEIWAEVDPSEPDVLREFRVVGTGNPKPEDCGVFLGTVLSHGGVYVWHLYEGPSGGV